MKSMAVCLLVAVCAGCAAAGSENAVPVREQYVETPDGVRLYFRVAGEGRDVVIAPNALYHGTALDSLAAGRRVVTYDPRGRGRSDAAPLEKVSLEHLLIDFETIRQAAGAETVSVIGWSGSGMEMFVYALRHPDRVERLVQLAPVAARFDPYGTRMMEDRESRTDEAAREALRLRREAGEFDGDPASECREVQKVIEPPTFAEPLNAPSVPDVCQFENEHSANIGAYFGKLFESIAGYDWRGSLDQVDIPRLVIHGEKDNTPLEGNREWVRGQANARLLIIRGAGHWPHYEKPEMTLRAIESFLDGQWPPGAEAFDGTNTVP